MPTLATVLILCAVAFAALTTPSAAPRRTPSEAARRPLAAAPLISAKAPDVANPNLLVLLVDTPSDADAWLMTEPYVLVLDASSAEASIAEALLELHAWSIAFDFVDLRSAN